jgi:hypothetical protein
MLTEHRGHDAGSVGEEENYSVACDHRRKDKGAATCTAESGPVQSPGGMPTAPSRTRAAERGQGRLVDSNDQTSHAMALGGVPVPMAQTTVRKKTVGKRTGARSQVDVKACFADARWKKEQFHYKPHPQEFSGPSLGLKRNWDKIPTMLQLFGLFWTRDTLRKICVETNRYAREKLTRENANGEIEFIYVVDPIGTILR